MNMYEHSLKVRLMPTEAADADWHQLWYHQSALRLSATPAVCLCLPCDA